MKLLLALVLLLTAPAVWADTHIHVDYGELRWSWSAGTGPTADGFTVKCTKQVTGSPVTTLHIADGSARSIALADIPLTAGTWSCTVAATSGALISSYATALTGIVEDFLPAPTSFIVTP